MQLLAPRQALSPVERPLPQPTAGQALIAVEACGVCRTDLHLLDGELPAIRYPIVPGHEIVGRIAALGSATQGLHIGQRVGVPWLGWSCGTCAQCRAGRENLCDDAALIFAPVGALVPVALRAVAKGGTVVCAGIHMSDIPAFPYAILWGERSVRSVANLTRRDGAEFFALTESIAIKTAVTRYPLVEANTALADLRAGRLQGAAVLVP